MVVVMKKPSTQWLSSLAGLVAVLIPKGLCPVCIAASGGMLTSAGLGVLFVEQNVRWLLAVTLSVGLLGFVISARRHRRWWTLAFGVIATCTSMAGRLLLSEPVLYVGLCLLVGSVIADAWARRNPWAPLVQIRLKKRGA